MQEKIQLRIEELKNEFAKGQVKLRDLQNQQLELNETLLRINGAIIALQGLLNENPTDQIDQP
jgi:hypothetical protein